MKKSIAIVLMILLAATCFAACGGGGGESTEAAEYDAENPMVLKLASDVPLEHIASTYNLEVVDEVKEATEGRVIIEYYPSSQLGSYETVYEEVMLGAVDMMENAVPDTTDGRLGASYVPYYALNADEMQQRFGQDSLMLEVMRGICAEQQVNFVGYCCEGWIGFSFVKNPTDYTKYLDTGMQGIQMRVPSTATFRLPVEDMGYSGVTVTYAEVPTAIQTGVVDGCTGTTACITYLWIGEIIETHVVNRIHMEATAWVASEKSLAKLTDEDREIVISCIQNKSEETFQRSSENEVTYRQLMRDDYGVEVYEYTDEQVADFAQYIRETTWPKLTDILTEELIADFYTEVGM